MKNAKIVLVAQWDGWCGACAVERPLVLTRRGRLGLRTWLTVPVVEPRPLTLTCRLCGNSSLVPSEQDDPPVLVELDDASPAIETAVLPVSALAPVPVAVEVPRTSSSAPVPGPATAPVAHAPVLQPLVPDLAPAGPEVDQARGVLGAALRALLAERTAQAGRVTLTPSVLPQHAVAVAAPALPLQRSSDADSLATLQLLADGLDLLSSSRA